MVSGSSGSGLAFDWRVRSHRPHIPGWRREAVSEILFTPTLSYDILAPFPRQLANLLSTGFKERS